jgi:hypothetical protein
MYIIKLLFHETQRNIFHQDQFRLLSVPFHLREVILEDNDFYGLNPNNSTHSEYIEFWLIFYR